MIDIFKINIDVLSKGKTEEIDISVPCNILDTQELDLHFRGNLDIQGEAYVVDQQLVLHVDVSAHALISCSICNGDAEVSIKLPNFYHVEDIEGIKSSFLDYHTLLRDEIVLQIPQFEECNNGKCPERRAITQYLNLKKSQGNEDFKITISPYMSHL